MGDVATRKIIVSELYNRYQANGFITENEALACFAAHKTPIIGDLIREYESIKREGAQLANRQSEERNRRAYAQIRKVENLAEMDWDAWSDEIAREKADDYLRATETADQREKEKSKNARGLMKDE